MIEIKGKYNSAKVFVDDYDKLEEACYKQIMELYSQKKLRTVFGTNDVEFILNHFNIEPTSWRKYGNSQTPLYSTEDIEFVLNKINEIRKIHGKNAKIKFWLQEENTLHKSISQLSDELKCCDSSLREYAKYFNINLVEYESKGRKLKGFSLSDSEKLKKLVSENNMRKLLGDRYRSTEKYEEQNKKALETKKKNKEEKLKEFKRNNFITIDFILDEHKRFSKAKLYEIFEFFEIEVIKYDNLRAISKNDYEHLKEIFDKYDNYELSKIIINEINLSKGIPRFVIQHKLKVNYRDFKYIINECKLSLQDYYSDEEFEIIKNCLFERIQRFEERKNKPKVIKLKTKYTKKQLIEMSGVSENTFNRIIKYLNIDIKNNDTIDDNIIRIKDFINSVDIKTFFFKKTNLEKLGVEYPFQSSRIQEKGKESCLEKYGVEYYNQTEESQIRRKETSLKKYGVENLSQNISIKIKKEKLEAKKLNYAKSQNLLTVDDLSKTFNRDESTIIDDIRLLNLKIIKFNNDTRFYIEESNLPILSDFFSKTDECGKSYSEKELVDFVKSIYSDEIMENTKRIIPPKELDIYIPKMKLAIEYNGLYWHDENHVDKNYHLTKTKMCNEKGIDLIHVFEDDWLYKKEIVKSMIASRLGVYKEKIFARKCQIKEIEKDQAKIFFDENHLQGFAYGDLYLGLMFNDELIQCICINKKGWHDGNVELTRMVTKLNTQVIGGFSKLMKHISDYIEYKSITSYVYKAWFNGKGYIESGFKIVKENNPSYSYVVNGRRVHKSHFRKDKIKKMFERGELKFYDLDKTEHENMIENKIYRIYDCGTMKVIYE